MKATLATVATSSADDRAFRALADICGVTEGMDVRIVGGLMTSLLLAAFPSTRAIHRRTADADAGLGTQLAASGEVHKALQAHGYKATSGNSYEKDGLQIDLLVPAATSNFTVEVLGGRAFDAAPGLMLALAMPPIQTTADVLLTTGESLSMTATLPSLEPAIVLKAVTYSNRRATKDLTDLHNLLLVVDEQEPKQIGGWSLGKAAESGARRDAQVALHELAREFGRKKAARNPDLDIRPEHLVSLIRTHVANPSD